MRNLTSYLLILFIVLVLAATVHADPLPSWQAGATKSAIINFVEQITTPGREDYIPQAERIAVFDNDGTLWAEQPYYFQIAYAMDRVKQMAQQNPALIESEPTLQAAAAGDLKGVLADGHEGLLKVLAASHAGMTTDDFKDNVARWLKTAKHPTKGRPYIDLVY